LFRRLNVAVGCGGGLRCLFSCQPAAVPNKARLFVAVFSLSFLPLSSLSSFSPYFPIFLFLHIFNFIPLSVPSVFAGIFVFLLLPPAVILTCVLLS